MLRHVRLSCAQLRHDLVYTPVAALQRLQDAKPAGLSQHLKAARDEIDDVFVDHENCSALTI